MQTDPKHPPEQTVASNGLLQNVRILLSMHSHRHPAWAGLVSKAMMARNAGATKIVFMVGLTMPDPSHAATMVRLRLCFSLICANGVLGISGKNN
jgi:hypothetical protein